MRENPSGLKALLAVVLLCLLHPLPVEAREKRIGVLMISEQARYSECLRGIRDELKKSGFGEQAARLFIQNADGSRARLTGFVQGLAAAKMDLIVAIGTPAALAAKEEIKDVPIVFSMVYDPVEAGIAKGWKSSGNNTTGSSTKFPVSRVLDRLKELAPVKRLGVLYTPGEKNTELQLIELKKAQEGSGIKVVPVIVSRKEDVTQVLPQVARTVDALYLTGSTVVGDNVSTITEVANREKVVTVSHLDDMIDRGALLGVCVDSYLLGRLAGKKAVRVLKGAKPSSIPIETEKRLDVILNRKTAGAGNFLLPPSFMKQVTKTVQ